MTERGMIKLGLYIMVSLLILCLVGQIIYLNVKIKHMESQKLNTVESIIYTRTMKDFNNTLQKALIAFREMNAMGREVDSQRIHRKRQLFEFDKWVIKKRNINGILRDVWEIDIQYGSRTLQQRLAQEGCLYLDFKSVYN